MSRPTFTGDYQFLTTKPNSRRLSKVDKEWLYILPIADMTSANLYYKMYFDDGTNITDSISLGDLREYEVKIVDISYLLVDYDSNITSPAMYIEKIEVYVGTASTEDSGDKLTYVPYTPKGERMTFYYANSYGGIDSLICTGDTSETIESDQQTARFELAHDADINEVTQYTDVNAKARRRFNINTSHMPDLEAKALRDLAIKKPIRIYKEINTTPVLLPCRLEPNRMGLPGSFTQLNTNSFTISYAFDDYAFDRSE